LGSADDEWIWEQGCKPIEGDLGLENNSIDIVVLSILAMKLLALKKIRIPCYLCIQIDQNGTCCIHASTAGC
jgi:hypothetical protein